jgi:hypothetical protein
MEPANQQSQPHEQPTPAQQVKADWRRLLDKLSYRGIVGNIPFIAFIALLGVVYISQNQSVIETQRELEKQQQILKELRWKWMDSKTKLMAAGTETEVIRSASALGLKPLMLPAYEVKQD